LLNSLIFEELTKAALLKIIRTAREFGDIALAHVGHLDESYANRISGGVFDLGECDRQ